MKTSTMVLIGVGAAAVVLLAVHMAGEGAVPLPGPGIFTHPAPSSGRIAFALPQGAREWALATLVSGTASTQLPLPAGTAALSGASAAGDVYTLAWHDALGNTQMAQVTLT